MNLVVPQQVKDRFSEAQAQVVAQVRGQLVALTELANTNYAGARQRLDALLPADLAKVWSGLRDRLQLLLDIAPRTELAQLHAKLDELQGELAIVATERAALKDELVKLLDDKLAALPAPVAPVETVAVAAPLTAPAIEVVEELAAAEPTPVAPAKPEPKSAGSNGKAKNGNQRRR